VDDVLLIFSLREARRKALTAARTEALCLLRDLNPAAPDRGPFTERGGVFWIALPPDALDRAAARLPRLGYTRAVDLPEDIAHIAVRRNSRAERVRWRKREYQLARLYEEDTEALRERARPPHVCVRGCTGRRARSDGLPRRQRPFEPSRPARM